MSYVEKLLGEEEEIVYVGRQHWFTVVLPLLGATIFAAIIVGAVVTAFWFAPESFPLPALMALVLLIFPLGKAVVDWLRWQSNVLVITNRRVIQVGGLIRKNVLDSSLEKVNDVSMEQGLWGRLFDYGDLEILTASESGANRFERIAHPVLCKTAMLDQKLLLEDGEEPPASTADIPTQIAKLAALREKGIVTDAEFQAKKTEPLSRM